MSSALVDRAARRRTPTSSSVRCSSPARGRPISSPRRRWPAMRPGAVLVDISIDQGGCFETSHVTTHSDPTYVVDGVVHYCVGNMPGAVPRTSTYALTNVTLPYVGGDRRSRGRRCGPGRSGARARGERRTAARSRTQRSRPLTARPPPRWRASSPAWPEARNGCRRRRPAPGAGQAREVVSADVGSDRDRGVPVPRPPHGRAGAVAEHRRGLPAGSGPIRLVPRGARRDRARPRSTRPSCGRSSPRSAPRPTVKTNDPTGRRRWPGASRRCGRSTGSWCGTGWPTAIRRGVSPSPSCRAPCPTRSPSRRSRRLLDAPTRQTPAGLRDRAILELLYGAGLRVSELTGLDVDDVDLEEGAVRVLGKGGKEREVPIGRYAREAVAAYLTACATDARHGLGARGAVPEPARRAPVPSEL